MAPAPADGKDRVRSPRSGARTAEGLLDPDRNRRPRRRPAFVVSGLLLATSPALAAVKGKAPLAGGGSGASLVLKPLNPDARRPVLRGPGHLHRLDQCSRLRR